MGSASSTVSSASLHAIARLFECSRPRLVELQPIRQLADDLAIAFTSALRDLAGLELALSVARLDQNAELPAELGQSVIATVAIPEWQEQLLIAFDRLLLFRVLDVMFGGNSNERTMAPERELTGLEQSIAVSIVDAFVERLQKPLASLCAFSAAPAVLIDESKSRTSAIGYNQLLLGLETANGCGAISIWLPAKPLERARELLAAVDSTEAPDLDPGWSQEFRRAVCGASIRLIASAEGPHLLLSDIAGLQPGTLLEFEPDALKKVKVEAIDCPVFIGRLGQSSGLFTVCLESPLSPDHGGHET